jgi:predicted AlkP superfamily pyrophosphatase or phosphodiesterase
MGYGRGIWWGALLLAVVSCSERTVDAPESYVVLVSFDGFRWDYPQLYDTPHFDEMASAGVKARFLIPSFPTKTFPNHYTLATGLYPDHNGIINNIFPAPDLGGIFQLGDRDMVSNPDAYFGEPIWITAKKQGIKTACYFWAGSEAPIGGSHPTYWKKYDGSIPYTERIDQVIRWLKLPVQKRPGLVTLYFEEPDATGHDFGPVHDSTAAVVQSLDQILGYLQGELNRLEYADRINLIILSDHGMGPISPERYVNIAGHLRVDWTRSVIGGNPVYLIDPEVGFADSVTRALNRIQGVNAWKAEEIPAHLHYGTSPRFPGILVAADSTWSIGTTPDASGYRGGIHGYDPRYTAMRTIFYADGPAFRKGYEAPPMNNVDVYSIMCRVLGLEPAPNDGDPRRVMDIFSTGAR